MTFFSQFLIVIACFVPLLAQSSSAKDWFLDIKGENSGHTVANFLSLPISAGSLSLGEVAATGLMDATDIPLYPANTALFGFQKVATTHCEWLMDTRIEYAGACFPIIDVGTVGTYFRIFTPGTFEYARTIDQEVSHPSMVEYAAGVSFASYFMEKALSLGATASYVESRLDQTLGRTAIINADAAYRPSPIVNLHLGISNIGPPITYVATKEPLPAQIDLSAECHPLALSGDLPDVFNMNIGAGARKISDEPLCVGLGLSASFFKQFSVRAAYDYTIGAHTSISGLSAGAGVELEKYGADFGWKYLSEDLGSIWGITVKMNLKEMTRKTAEDYYRTAEKYYAKGNVWLCVFNAKKAIKLNPNMWKAHALIARANALERRENNLEAAIIYTGNDKGQILPMALPKGMMGGLARKATIINQLAAQFPTHIIIDCGNGITPASHPLKAKLMQRFYDRVKFDAVSVGDQEMRYGLGKLYPAINQSKTQYVFTNLISRFGLGNVEPKKMIAKNGYGFQFLSIVAPALLTQQNEREKLFVPADEIHHHLAKSANVRILVSHDNWENMAAYSKDLQPGDIIIAGNMKQEFSTPMKIGPALVLSPGEYGKYVGYCIIRFSPEGKKIISCENHLIAVTEDIAPDPAMEADAKAIAAKVEIDSAGIDDSILKNGETSGIFAFCSNRNDVNAIYLKVLAKNAEFPLTSGAVACGAPIVSFAASKIAYLEKNADSSCPRLCIMDLSGTQKRSIPMISCPKGAAFSPDGQWLYFSATLADSTSDLFRMKSDGMVLNPVIAWKNSNEGEVAFSPDGKSMAFGSNANGKWQLFISDPYGQKPICITDGTGDFTSPKFSPNGKLIALLSNKTSFNGTKDLWVYDPATSKLIALTHDAAAREFCWISNETIIASCGKDTTGLIALSVFSHESKIAISSGSIKNYNERSPMLINVGHGQKLVYTKEYFDGKRKVFWVNTDGTNDQCVIGGEASDWLE